VWWDDAEVRAELPGAAHGHRGAHPESPRRVRTG
jgi:hypothetical protein